MAKVVVATAFGGPQVLSTVEEAVPDPGPDEVTIRVRAAAVNPLDYLRYSGMFGADPSWLPMRVGQELAGVVTAAGTDAVGPAGPVQVGDEVIAYPGDVAGAYAGEVTWPARGVVPKPADLGWEPASGLLLASGTAVHALVATGLTSNDVVLIHGVSGSVGMIAAQLAIHRGARVIGTAGAARHEVLRRYGVEPVSYGDGLAERVRAQAPDGVDAAIDAVGTDEALDTSLAVVSDRERIATIVAFERGNQAGIKTLGAGGGATDPGTEIRAQAWSELTSLAAEGKLEVVVARTFGLAEAAAANELVLAGHAGGKVVLLP
ncbi:MAG: NADP-dependent oxidoreductase [Pseudonocardiaceae bacterium]